MNLDKFKELLTLLMVAFGLFALTFIIYSMIIISRIAQDKKRHEIKNDYANEHLSPSVTPGPKNR